MIGAMDLEIFVTEIHMQARNVMFAWTDLTAANKENDEDRAWYAIQAMLIAAANLSKIFFVDSVGSKKLSKLRAQALCSMFDVGVNSPLYDRRMRNHFEHFDERLDEWNSERVPSASVFVDRKIYPVNKPYARIQNVGGHAVRPLRELHPGWKLSCLGDELDLQELIASAMSLLSINPITRIEEDG